METVSVIVPVYNVKRYLPRCIESILRQSHTELEIILVDDGSTDGSGAVCDRYAAKDERIRVVHKRNEGVSSARNTGLELSTGQYVMFVDSDDWLALRAIETLYQRITEDHADLAIAEIESVDSIRRSKSKSKEPSGRFCLNNPEGFLAFFKTGINWFGPVAKLFCTHIIRRHQLVFPLGIKNGEDTIFVLDYLKRISRVSYSDRVMYFYNRLIGDSAVLRYNRELYRAIVEIVCLLYDAVKQLGIENDGDAWSVLILQELRFLIRYYASFGIDYSTFEPIFRETLDALRSRNPGMLEALRADEENAELLRCVTSGDCEALYRKLQGRNAKPAKRSGIAEAVKAPVRRFKKWLLFDLRLWYRP